MKQVKRWSWLGLWLACAAVAYSEETLPLWPDLAPGEKVRREDQENPQKDGIRRIHEVTSPTLTFFAPEEKRTDACVVIFPGGGYQILAYDYEGTEIADFFNQKGMAAVVVKYRVPRRDGVPKHQAAWQDAQRAIRLVRANADKWGIDPDKIGAMGFSAGGHLTLLTALNSQTPAYQPIDELDKIPCHISFAVPVYPAYVLEDGKDGANKEKGNDSPMVNDFAWDAKTPPMCLIHGDADGISAMGSVAVYHELRKRNIPAELHIYAKIGHGFGARPQGDHLGNWLPAVYAWLKESCIF
ncbi:MAG: alpha/beta hydrolase [Planctomycetia bacterium]|nr:alpha/beta hydrolase [Planctomycetia bacterium]